MAMCIQCRFLSGLGSSGIKDEPNARIYDIIKELLEKLGAKGAAMKAAILYNSLISFSVSAQTAAKHSKNTAKGL